MQDILFILLGLTVGSVGTLIGAGGGFLLMPIFFYIFPNQTPEELTAMSLCVVLANAISGSIAYSKKKRIDYKSSIFFTLFTVPGAFIGLRFLPYLKRDIYEPFFGLFLLVAGTYLIIFPDKKLIKQKIINSNEKLMNIELEDAEGNSYKYSYNKILACAISLLVGFVSTLLGVGGGILHVPFMIHSLGFPILIATATSHLTLGLTSFIGVSVHYFNNHIQNWHVIIMLVLGAVVGAQFGAKISNYINSKHLIRILAFAIIIVGLRLLFIKTMINHLT